MPREPKSDPRPVLVNEISAARFSWRIAGGRTSVALAPVEQEARARAQASARRTLSASQRSGSEGEHGARRRQWIIAPVNPLPPISLLHGGSEAFVIVYCFSLESTFSARDISCLSGHALILNGTRMSTSSWAVNGVTASPPCARITSAVTGDQRSATKQAKFCRYQWTTSNHWVRLRGRYLGPPAL